MSSTIKKDFDSLRAWQKRSSGLAQQVDQISGNLESAVRGVLNRSDIPERGAIADQYTAIHAKLNAAASDLSKASKQLNDYIVRGIQLETLLAALLGQRKLDDSAMKAVGFTAENLAMMASNISLEDLSKAKAGDAETLARVRVFNKILVAYGVAYSAKDLAEVIRAKRWNLDDNLKAANAGLGLTGAGAAGTKGFATLMKPLANSSPKWATVGKFAGRVNPIALGLQANIVGYQVGKGRADTLIEQEAKGLDTVGIAKQDLSDRPWYAKPVGGYNVLTAKTRREAGEHFLVCQSTSRTSAFRRNNSRLSTPGSRHGSRVRRSFPISKSARTRYLCLPSRV